MGRDLYHYTDKQSYLIITRRQNIIKKIMTWLLKISPSDLLPGSGNAYYGKGVYFTDLSPKYARSTIAGVCFGNSQSQIKTECFIHLRFHGNTKITQAKDHVFIVSPSSMKKSHPVLLNHGYTDEFEN